MHVHVREATMLACRQIPGYPRIDRNNDYLIARFDGLVIDAKPWLLEVLSEVQRTGSYTSANDSSPEREACIRDLHCLEVTFLLCSFKGSEEHMTIRQLWSCRVFGSVHSLCT